MLAPTAVNDGVSLWAGRSGLLKSSPCPTAKHQLSTVDTAENAKSLFEFAFVQPTGRRPSVSSYRRIRDLQALIKCGNDPV